MDSHRPRLPSVRPPISPPPPTNPHRYNVFLPAYLSSRGAAFGETSPYITWRNYALVNFSGIWGPVLAGYMCHTRLGRKYTMVIGALVTMAFFFAYTQVRTSVQNIVFTCVINFCLNVYYGTLYAYTPEVLPSAHRGTGNGIAIGWNRVMGILSAVIATVADVSVSPLLIVLDVPLTVYRRVRQCQFIFVRRCISLWRLLRRCSRSNRMASGVRSGLSVGRGGREEREEE